MSEAPDPHGSGASSSSASRPSRAVGSAPPSQVPKREMDGETNSASSSSSSFPSFPPAAPSWGVGLPPVPTILPTALFPTPPSVAAAPDEGVPVEKEKKKRSAPRNSTTPVASKTEQKSSVDQLTQIQLTASTMLHCIYRGDTLYVGGAVVSAVLLNLGRGGVNETRNPFFLLFIAPFGFFAV